MYSEHNVINPSDILLSAVRLHTSSFVPLVRTYVYSPEHVFYRFERRDSSAFHLSKLKLFGAKAGTITCEMRLAKNDHTPDRSYPTTGLHSCCPLSLSRG